MGVVVGTGDVAGSLTGAFLLLRSEKQEPRVAPRPAATADCVQQAANGDVRAFEELYSIHLPRVHSLVRRMTGGRDADELTQDIFVRVWQKLGSFRGESAFGTWLHRLAVNVVIEPVEQAGGRGYARVRVSDNGCGMEPGQKLGFGLVGMRERILALGGTLNVVSGDGGLTVEALVPTAAS